MDLEYLSVYKHDTFFVTWDFYTALRSSFQDFLGLVEKFFYLSGQYDIELTVGDSVMVNVAF